MDTLTWGPALRVGVSEFDRDHRILIGMYNDLFAACQAGAGAARVHDILGRLLAYTNDHFRREEQSMRRLGYPGTAEHEMAHDALVIELDGFRAELERGRLRTLDCKALTFIHGWITEHAVTLDRAYGVFFNERGVF